MEQRRREGAREGGNLQGRYHEEDIGLDTLVLKIKNSEQV